MARLLLRSAALLLLLSVAGLLLPTTDAFIPSCGSSSSLLQQQPEQQQQQQRRRPAIISLSVSPSDSTSSSSSNYRPPTPPSLFGLQRLQRALAPLALSLLPLLAPRPLAPPAVAATMQQQTTTLLLADAEEPGIKIKEVDDVEALAGFGKGQGEEGARLMGRIQPVSKLTPDQEGLFKRARIAESDNEFEKALRLYDRLTRVSPGYAYAWSNKGNAQIALGDLESGLDAYKRAIELLPGKSGDAWLVYLNKATTELALGRVDACLADLDEARALHGQPDVLLFANRALALERLGKYGEALENYQNAVLTKPKEVSPWWLRYSLVLFQEQQDIKAMEIMRKVAGKFAKVDEIQAALATLVYGYGDTVEAERLWGEMSGQAQVQYRDESFLREKLRWPERMVKTLADFKGLYTPRKPATA